LPEESRKYPAALRRENGVRFAEHRIIENYRYRPPYSDEVFDALLGLIRDEPRAVLDAGCGPGKIARVLANSVARVDGSIRPRK
jgi:2-polyprenyl-3-methyl-5-hydroxy-6-metoxy-1,4-benzoquinol methylase